MVKRKSYREKARNRAKSLPTPQFAPDRKSNISVSISNVLRETFSIVEEEIGFFNPSKVTDKALSEFVEKKFPVQFNRAKAIHQAALDAPEEAEKEE